MKRMFIFLGCCAMNAMIGMPAFSETLPAEVPAVTLESAISTEQNSVSSDNTTIAKDISLSVQQNAGVNNSAGSSNTESSSITGNKVVERTSTAPFVRPNNDSRAILTQDSFSGASGVISVNQAPGNIVNQGNAIAVSYVDGTGAFLGSEAVGHKSITKNVLDAVGAHRSNMIDENAFTGASGIIGVNQSSGHMNNQNNIVSLSIGEAPMAALSDSALGMVSGNNNIIETGVSKTDIIAGSAFKGVKGIISINQSSGSMNSQVNIISISVNGSFLK